MSLPVSERRALRLRMGMTQSVFAALAGTSQTSISQWETGKVDLPPAVELRLLRAVQRVVGAALLSRESQPTGDAA